MPRVTVVRIIIGRLDLPVDLCGKNRYPTGACTAPKRSGNNRISCKSEISPHVTFF